MASHRRPRRSRLPLLVLVAAALLMAAGVGLGVAASSDSSGRAAQALPTASAAPVHAGFVTRRLTIPAGYASAGRGFVLHEAYGPGSARPLVLLLHGLYQSPATVEQETAATSYSDAEGFTLAYPIGIGEAWNAGGCCAGDRADDLAYLVDIVHYVATLTPVDRAHVYIWGFSNGGMMAWRAVCQTNGVFAGAGVMSGALLVPCPRVVHAVVIAGAKDSTVPYYGGFSWYTRTVMPDSADVLSRLRPGSTVQQTVIPGLGHRWPPLGPGRFDAIARMWSGLRGYAVVATPVLG